MKTLIDRPVPDIDTAVTELYRVRRLPKEEQTEEMRAATKAAVIAAMLRARVARYQGRMADGELFHVSISLPTPALRVNLGGEPTKKPKSAANPSVETETPES